MLVCDLLVKAAAQFPQKSVIIQGDRRYSYADLLQAARSKAQWLLASKYPKGFRGALFTDDAYEYISGYFAIQMAGGIVVGLNTQTSERSLLATLQDCGASVIFSGGKFCRYLEKLMPQLDQIKNVVVAGSTQPQSWPAAFAKQWITEAEVLGTETHGASLASPLVEGNDLAQIIYTSGTTGAPKGVMLRHSNIVANTHAIVTYLHLAPADRAMVVLPFFYSYGNSVMLTHIAVGGSMVVNQNFLYPNVILDEMVKEEVTGFSGVPSTFALLLHRSAVHKYQFPCLRYLTQAGAAMAPKLTRSLKDVFPGVDIFIMYGQTEASARLSYLPPEDLERKPGSIGKAIPGVTLKLLNQFGHEAGPGEVGEIVALGENIMAGYWGRPEDSAKTLRPEGLRTGDLAQMDAEEYLYIVSRKSDMIKSGSHRIAPKELEEIIHELASVQEVAVVGIKDDILGELIKACVVLRTGTNCTKKEITIYCRQNLPAYKVPHLVEFYQALPKTATGKIRKGKLAAMADYVDGKEGTNA